MMYRGIVILLVWCIDTPAPCIIPSLLPTLLDCIGALQGLWSHWGALIIISLLPYCCQWQFCSILQFVYIPVAHWEHIATVCDLMCGRTGLWFASPPTHPFPPSHPLSTHLPPYIQHLWYYRGCIMLSQKPAVNSYETLAGYKSTVLIQQILRGYNVAQENHSCFNISKWHFSKYKMWQLGQFL